LKMSQLATGCSKPDATERLVALVEDLAAKE
jgi:acyl-CoA-binding protein